MSLKGNKGEWSEVYTLFKILGEKKLYAGTDNLEKVENLIYPIIKVLRTESNGNFEYSYLSEKNLVIVSSEKGKLVEISVQEFQQKAQQLLSKIKENFQTTFPIPEIEEFMNKIHCQSLKASSCAKTDITIVIHDERTNQTPTLGFSIKSQLGNPSTLLNAGKTTNFIYKISGIQLTQEEINDINAIKSKSKIKDRITKIKNKGGLLNFTKTEKSIFSNNLILIDSRLPQIISQIVYEFYSSNLSHINDLVNVVEQKNPLKFDTSNNHKFYSYKIKRFLTDTALGMMPSKVWNGYYDATGGYLVIKEDGDILCYHIYNRNDFENYLLNNTKLETASSSRHKFGSVYQENGELFIKLNLQIRFVK